MVILKKLFRKLKSYFCSAAWGSHKLIPLCEDRVFTLIYDSSTQPISIGDFLLFIICGKNMARLSEMPYVNLIVFAEYNCGRISKKKGGVLRDNSHLSNIFEMVKLIELEVAINNIEIYSHRCRFISKVESFDRDSMWPNLDTIRSGRYLFYEIVNNSLRSLVDNNRSISGLCPSAFILEKVMGIRSKFRERRICTINIRNNKSWDLGRNSNIDAWLDFLDAHANNDQWAFIVLCSKAELDSRFIDSGNVMIARHHYDSLLIDLALIATSDIHFGCASGPATAAWFKPEPMVIYNSNLAINSAFFSDGLLTIHDDYKQYVFSPNSHRYYEKRETREMICADFQRIVNSC